MVWVVLCYKGDREEWADYEVAGVFSSEEKALAACRDYGYCLACFELDERLPHARVVRPGKGFRFPNTKPREEVPV